MQFRKIIFTFVDHLMGCVESFHVALQLFDGGALVILVRCDGGKAPSLFVLHVWYLPEAFIHVMTK